MYIYNTSTTRGWIVGVKHRTRIISIRLFFKITEGFYIYMYMYPHTEILSPDILPLRTSFMHCEISFYTYKHSFEAAKPRYLTYLCTHIYTYTHLPSRHFISARGTLYSLSTCLNSLVRAEPTFWDSVTDTSTWYQENVSGRGVSFDAQCVIPIRDHVAQP